MRAMNLFKYSNSNSNWVMQIVFLSIFWRSEENRYEAIFQPPESDRYEAIWWSVSNAKSKYHKTIRVDGVVI